MIHSELTQKQITFMYCKANFWKRFTMTRNIYTHTYRFFFFWVKHHIPKTMKSMRINLIWLSTPIPKMQHGWIEMQRIGEWSKPKSLVKNFYLKIECLGYMWIRQEAGGYDRCFGSHCWCISWSDRILNSTMLSLYSIQIIITIIINTCIYISLHKLLISSSNCTQLNIPLVLENSLRDYMVLAILISICFIGLMNKYLWWWKYSK